MESSVKLFSRTFSGVKTSREFIAIYFVTIGHLNLSKSVGKVKSFDFLKIVSLTNWFIIRSKMMILDDLFFSTWSTKIQKSNPWRLVQITNPDNLRALFSSFTRLWHPFGNIPHQKFFHTHWFQWIWLTESAILRVCCKLSTKGFIYL